MSADDGSVSVLTVAILAIAALMCLATADAANVLTARARAQAAADAAALAAAAAQWRLIAGEEPIDAAERTAIANGATLESCDCDLRADASTVVVSIATHIRMLGAAPRRVSARATATLDPGAVFRPPE